MKWHDDYHVFLTSITPDFCRNEFSNSWPRRKLQSYLATEWIFNCTLIAIACPKMSLCFRKRSKTTERASAPCPRRKRYTSVIRADFTSNNSCPGSRLKG